MNKFASEKGQKIYSFFGFGREWGSDLLSSSSSSSYFSLLWLCGIVEKIFEFKSTKTQKKGGNYNWKTRESFSFNSSEPLLLFHLRDDTRDYVDSRPRGVGLWHLVTSSVEGFSWRSQNQQDRISQVSYCTTMLLTYRSYWFISAIEKYYNDKVSLKLFFRMKSVQHSSY